MPALNVSDYNDFAQTQTSVLKESLFAFVGIVQGTHSVLFDFF